MNPAETVTVLATVIENASCSPDLRYELWYSRGEFFCTPWKPGKPHEISIAIYTGETLTKGLTEKQWSDLQRKICYLMKGGVVCPKPLKLFPKPNPQNY